MQLHLVDLRPSYTAQQVSEQALYRKFARGEAISPYEARQMIPQREEFAAVWRYLASHSGDVTEIPVSLARKIAKENDLWESTLRTMVCLEVLESFGLVTIQKGRGGDPPHPPAEAAGGGKAGLLPVPHHPAPADHCLGRGRKKQSPFLTTGQGERARERGKPERDAEKEREPRMEDKLDKLEQNRSFTPAEAQETPEETPDPFVKLEARYQELDEKIQKYCSPEERHGSGRPLNSPGTATRGSRGKTAPPTLPTPGGGPPGGRTGAGQRLHHGGPPPRHHRGHRGHP